MKRNTLGLLLTLCCALWLTAFQSPSGQQSETEQPAVIEAPAEEAVTEEITDQAGSQLPKFTQINDIESLWQLTELGGGIRWAIFLVFAGALFLILKKLIELFVDSIHARDLERVPITDISFEDLQATLKKSRPTLIGYLMEKLFEIYYNTGRVEVLQEELSTFRKVQEDQFSRFKTRMLFLADTAGALGLIGTVWGMFLTFFGGSLDSQRILNGMGIALITTLMGLVVSIVINFASTEVANYFNKRIEAIFEIVDYLRMRMIGNKEQEMHLALAAAAMKYESVAGKSLESADGVSVNPISNTSQRAIVGRPLSKPLTLQVFNGNGVPLEGVEVVFSLNGNGGYFPGKKTRFLTSSNKKGQVSAHFQLDTGVGEREINAAIVNQEHKKVEFSIEGVPAPPTRIELVSGNHQSDVINKKLDKPFIVAVFDAFNNPIPGLEVTFLVTKGTGRFANQHIDEQDDQHGLIGRLKHKIIAPKETIEVHTDDNGIAEALFILGHMPGINQISATARGLNKTFVSFDAMGQPEEEPVA